MKRVRDLEYGTSPVKLGKNEELEKIENRPSWDYPQLQLLKSFNIKVELSFLSSQRQTQQRLHSISKFLILFWDHIQW